MTKTSHVDPVHGYHRQKWRHAEPVEARRHAPPEASTASLLLVKEKVSAERTDEVYRRKQNGRSRPSSESLLFADSGHAVMFGRGLPSSDY